MRSPSVTSSLSLAKPGLFFFAPRKAATSRVRYVVEDDREQSGYLQINHPAPSAGFFAQAVTLGQMIEVFNEVDGPVLLVDAVERYYVHSGDARVKQFVTRMADGINRVGESVYYGTVNGRNVLVLMTMVMPVGVLGGILTRGETSVFIMPLAMVWIQGLLFYGVARLRFYDIEIRAVRTGELAAAAAEQERLAVVGELSASLAHEIRNPLTGLRSLAQRLISSSTSGAVSTVSSGGRLAGGCRQTMPLAPAAIASLINAWPSARSVLSCSCLLSSACFKIERAGESQRRPG